MVYVPFITGSWLERRKGGGGGGRVSSTNTKSTSSSSSKSSSSYGSTSKSSSSSSSSGKSSSSSSSSSSWWSSSSSSSSKSSTKYKTSSTKSSAKYKTIKTDNTWYKQVGVASTIPAGYYFAGRVAGGGTREGIYGTRTYGSGYPGVVGRGTSGRGFPFFFWPLAWPAAVGGGAAAGLYLHNNYEYGQPSNTTRPGGPMAFTIFTSLPGAPTTVTNATTNETTTITPPASTFRFLADNSTVLLMNNQVGQACAPLLASNPAGQTPLLFSEFTTTPAPEQAVQYYRASSAVLSLDGYINAATYAVEGTQDTPLPVGTNLELLACLNSTIGSNLPLIDAAVEMGAGLVNVFGVVGLVMVLLFKF